MLRWVVNLKVSIRIFVVMGLLVGLVFLPGKSAIAATLIVTTNADSGAGSLRQAIADASPGDTISFDPNLPVKTITLSSTLTISKSLTIEGLSSTPGITISGRNIYRVFSITAGTVIISNLTVQNGNASSGGNIYISGSGTDVTLNNMSIANARATIGAGVYISGPGAVVTINNSAIINNSLSANNGGGGILLNSGSSLVLNNSTVSGNRAYNGGGILNAGILTINSSTITNNTASHNGGGLENLGTLSLRNTLLAGNISQALLEPDCYTPAGGITQSHGYNVIRVALSECPIASAANPGTDRIGTNANPVEPLLGPLQDNGGPTQTYLPLTGSPAIDAIPGCNSAPAQDQRGISRPQGASCDIGSVEIEVYDPPSVTLSSTASSPTRTSPIPLTFTFSKPVTGFSESDILVANGTILAGSLLGSGANYTASLLPAASGTVTVNLPAGAAVDSGGEWQPGLGAVFDHL